MDVWKDIPGFEGLYQASTGGEVRSLDRVVTKRDGTQLRLRGRLLKQNLNGSGYRQVVLSVPGKQSNLFVHRIVAATFLGEVAPGQDVCHNNGIKADNALSNLRIDTRAGNMADCREHGTAPIGEANAGSVLDAGQVKEIRILFSRGDITRRELADTYGVSVGNISAILTGLLWPQVGGPIVPKSTGKGEDSTTSKITEADVREIREKYATGAYTQKALATQFGLSRPSISLIVNRKNWAHVI